MVFLFIKKIFLSVCIPKTLVHMPPAARQAFIYFCHERGQGYRADKGYFFSAVLKHIPVPPPPEPGIANCTPQLSSRPRFCMQPFQRNAKALKETEQIVHEADFNPPQDGISKHAGVRG